MAYFLKKLSTAKSIMLFSGHSLPKPIMAQGNPNTKDVERDCLQRTTNVLRTVLSELESPVSAPSPSSASAQSSSTANVSDDFR